MKYYIIPYLTLLIIIIIITIPTTTKQDNIGFDIRGDVKLFDFGLARRVSFGTGCGGGGLRVLRVSHV
jgi:hypothetical protein